MKFGIFSIVPYHEDFTQQQALTQALEQIQFADEAGLDEVWLGEHRFSRHGLLSGIWSFLGAVAGRTKNLRIGTAVIVLPLHNPVLVAEEVAMLDIISNGRFNFGIGAGYQQQEFDGVGVDIDTSRDRFHEAVDVMIKAWTEENLTYHGRFTDVDDVWVLPKPLQKPYPPLFQAVSTSPASIDFAASRNIQVIAGGPTDILGQAPQVIKLWREKMEEYGHEHAHLDPPMSKSIYVAPTMEEAERDAAELENFSSRIPAVSRLRRGAHRYADGPERQGRQGLRALGQPSARPRPPGRPGPCRSAAASGNPRGGDREVEADSGSRNQPRFRQLRLCRPAPLRR